MLLLCVTLGSLWMYFPQTQGAAQEEAKYVGSDVCAKCHAEVTKTWALTVHRRTLFNKDPSRNGCEACHGPGGPHVEGGGNPEKMIKLGKLKPEQSAAICQKCHSQEKVTLWATSLHSRAKLTCMDCHDPHSPGERKLLTEVENAKLSLEGLTRSLKQAELAANIAAEGSDEKAEANKKVEQLNVQRDKLRKELKGRETAYRRVAEPYLCYNCHKPQQVQSRMVSHHPIQEGKMKCSDCHNSHGGPMGMLTAESVQETCFRCHADKVGPFTFDHPPVTEDCTICHSPHGSVQDRLLVQSQPFVCLKCHAGPHSRTSLATGEPFGKYYTECTDCHNQIHGSDTRPSFRH